VARVMAASSLSRDAGRLRLGSYLLVVFLEFCGNKLLAGLGRRLL